MFGQYVRARREALELTQREVAAASGLTQEAISVVENRADGSRTTAATLAGLAQVDLRL